MYLYKSYSKVLKNLIDYIQHSHGAIQVNVKSSEESKPNFEEAHTNAQVLC